MLKETINQEFTTAFKNKNTFRKDTLGLLKTKITEAEKKDNTTITEDKIYSIVSSMVKQREQSIEAYNKNSSEQAKLNAKKESDEILILKEFLPLQMTNEEIKDKIGEFVVESFPVFTTKEQAKVIFNAVMKEFNSSYKGRFDNKKLKEITEEVLCLNQPELSEEEIEKQRQEVLKEFGEIRKKNFKTKENS